MGIKFNEKRNSWDAFFTKRHPKTRMPKSLRRTGIKSQAEARRIERELVVKIDRSFDDDITPIWSALLEECLIVKSRTGAWGPKTCLDYKCVLESHTYSAWRDRRIDKILPQEIANLVAERVGEYTQSYQQTVLKQLRVVFQFAVDSGYLKQNPVPSVRLKIGEKIRRVLTEDQAKMLLQKARELESFWFPHWAMALYTGMRNGELFALTWDKVNLDERKILVDSSWTKLNGFKDTKSGDDRNVEIAPNLVAVLKELRLKSGASHFVLPRCREWEMGEQARQLKLFLLGIGLPPVKFHDLRATWATLLLGKGIAPIKVMIMGGWKDLKTMQIYIRKAGVDIRGITDGLRLHEPERRIADVLQFEKSSEL